MNSGILTIILVSSSILIRLGAQSGPVSSGGDASSSSGKVSYSIGQIIYTTASGKNKTVTPGMQQPYRISTFIDSEVTISVFPNPVTDNLITLRITGSTNEKYSFDVRDLLGRVSIIGEVTANETIIHLDDLANAACMLIVYKGEKKIVHAFKVIKSE